MGAPFASAPRSRTQRLLALLVDRDAEARQMYADYLKRFAYDVDDTGDGRDALAKALTHRPDVIIADRRLPGIDGLALCSLLRRDPTTRDIPIIVVMAESSTDDLRQAAEAGASRVLVKPCLPEALLQEVQRVAHAAPHLETPPAAASPRVRMAGARTVLSHAHERRDTTDPPIAPPRLRCPNCDTPLLYQRSHVGGVNARHQEQWDYYACETGCGTFQYRQRTRRLRLVS